MLRLVLSSLICAFIMSCGSSNDEGSSAKTTLLGGGPSTGFGTGANAPQTDEDEGTTSPMTMVAENAPQCTDQKDNDGDGLIDLADPGCRNARDNDERDPQCADGLDNDGDGLVDTFDPGCGSTEDNDETNAAAQPECGDGLDNDANGLVDEEDPGCESTTDVSERFVASDAGAACATSAECPDSMGCRAGRCLPPSPACNDLKDNDADGLIDFPEEPGCLAAGDDDESDPIETPACMNTVDDDGDGLVDYPNDPGCAGKGDTSELDKIVTPACADRQDNDRDGLADGEDPECRSAADGSERGACLDEYDPPSITTDESLIVNSADGVFETEGTCGGVGSPEKVVLFRLNSDLEALIISTANPGTVAPSTLYVRYRDCLSTAQQVEMACATEAATAQTPGQTIRIPFPRKGDYFIFVDGVSGAGGTVELSVSEIALPQCSNGMDDDGDGKSDYPEDPGCLIPDDRDEADTEPGPQCGNGADDDGDGLTDYPDDPGCPAASWDTEADSCGAGVRINEYPFGATAVFGNTQPLDLSSSLQPASPANCGVQASTNDGLKEIVYLYRNPYRARLVVSTDYPETLGNTVVYVRSKCGDPLSELGCNAGAPMGAEGSANKGTVSLSGVEPGNYFIVVDTKFGVGEKFKLSVESSIDEPQCADHIDNDRDGRIDDDDPECSAPRDNREDRGPDEPQCNDGRDNDGDMLIDYPVDPGCLARGDTNESDGEDADGNALLTACNNQLDDDLDGLIDAQDPGCTSAGDLTEQDLRIPPACSNGRDDDEDGAIDYPNDPDCLFAGGRSEGR
ncbi:MAG: hypothetical protein VX589_09970 [Myxococcota bacterium]|nr:hypothetical protein [Myxococcota bacterium]